MITSKNKIVIDDTIYNLTLEDMNLIFDHLSYIMDAFTPEDWVAMPLNSKHKTAMILDCFRAHEDALNTGIPSQLLDMVLVIENMGYGDLAEKIRNEDNEAIQIAKRLMDDQIKLRGSFDNIEQKMGEDMARIGKEMKEFKDQKPTKKTNRASNFDEVDEEEPINFIPNQPQKQAIAFANHIANTMRQIDWESFYTTAFEQSGYDPILVHNIEQFKIWADTLGKHLKQEYKIKDIFED